MWFLAFSFRFSVLDWNGDSLSFFVVWGLRWGCWGGGGCVHVGEDIEEGDDFFWFCLGLVVWFVSWLVGHIS